MNNEQDNDLTQLWQGIETEPECSAEELTKLAHRKIWINRLIFAWDIGLTLVLLLLIYLAINNGFSYVAISWLGIVTLFSLWLTVQFNNYRQASVQVLTNSMASFNQYLIDKANTDIRVGKLFNIANGIVSISMASVFIYEQWFTDKPIVTEASQWYFVIGWSVIWVSTMFAYGAWKIAKGKKALARLNQYFEQE